MTILFVLEFRRPLGDEGGHALLLIGGGEQEWNTRRSKRTPSASEVSNATLTASFAASTDGSDIDAIVSAVFIASSSRLASGTMRATRPARSASFTSIMRPVSMMSMALALPTARVKRCVPPMPGMTPSLISGWPNFALSAAMMNVALHGELAAAAERKACDRGDHRLAHGGGPIPVRGEVAQIGFGEGLFRHFLDVGAGGESLVGAGDHDAADIGVGLEGVERVRQVGHQRAVERIERLRAVEPDQADLAAGFDNDVLVSHGVSLGVLNSSP